MGTRSLTYVENEQGTPILCMYRQFDGYPSGHGDELAKYLAAHRIVNGFGAGDTWENAFNGAGCMAASIVAHFKESIGGFYLYDPSEENADHGQEWVYTVSVKNSKPSIKVKSVYDDGKVWEGYATEFDWKTVEATFSEED